ncbi:MAG: P-type conjugative transfer ATPase TrbB [Planctomycetota bacterium]|jgi:type IV secretion system protein VirB11|nr:P-type conjugative transfer ATPase TrbB [Planctomycetota bacterium]
MQIDFAAAPARPAAIEKMIHGPPGSRTVVRRKVNRLHDASNAEFEKLLAVARQLPAVAFDALFDADTIELMLNPDGEVWHERLGQPMTHICDMEESKAAEFIRQIAGCLGKTVTEANPLLEGVLPLDDSRFAGQIPPAVAHPAFAIRKRAVRVFTLNDYILSGVMTLLQCELIRQAVEDRQNILIIGGTGTGKTTLGNAVLHEITVFDPGARQIIIEDTPELNSTAVNKVNYQTSPGCTMTDLLRTALRMRPDRIIVGEVRGPEAFDLLQAWNTGHPGGVATLHANDCASGLRRLKSLVSQHQYAPRDIEPDIALAVRLLVAIVKENHGRRVREIVEVDGYNPAHPENNGYKLTAL